MSRTSDYFSPFWIAVDWFEETFGFREKNYKHTRKQFQLEEDDTILHSLANGRKFQLGKFEIPSVEELNLRLSELTLSETSGQYSDRENSLEFEHWIGGVKGLLHDPQNAGAVFQAESHFNLLEGINSQVKPDSGITDYVDDRSQGPTCAVACSAGTIYRNYLLNKYGQGGKRGKQIDCIAEAGEILGNEKDKFWKMQNGYVSPSENDSMFRLKRTMYGGFLMSREAMNKVRVGVHWDTEVVERLERPEQPHHCVTQVYCAALQIGFCTKNKMRDFEPFAKLILDAAYQATFAVAAIKALESNERINLYLTKVGGGCFGNRSRWIVDAIRKCLRKYEDYPLNVFLVHDLTLEQAYIQGLKGSKEIKHQCVISNFISSHINFEKLIISPDTTVCSNDDSTALMTSSSPNCSDESIQYSTSSMSALTKEKKIDENDGGDEKEKVESKSEESNPTEVESPTKQQYRHRRLFSRESKKQ